MIKGRSNMKNIALLILFFGMIVTTVHSQEKSKKEIRKELKEKQKLEDQKITEGLVNSKSFVFVPITALPTGMRSINLTSNNYDVSFQPELIESYLPFFGNASGSVAYSPNQGGIKFKEKPEEFNVEIVKNKYEIKVVVKDNFDTYSLFLSIGMEGYASLRIISNKRSIISYNGNISALKDSKINEKKEPLD